ncbi:MAG: hypothetical protein ACPGGK_11145 [Pikeienuella sp.]
MKKFIFGLAVLGAATGANAGTRLPLDSQQTCPVTAAEFNSWYAGGFARSGGLVNEANSTAFPPVNNTLCDFYKWSSQMFLWLTSPIGQNTHIFDSPIFYDVVGNGSGGLKFEQNSWSTPNNFALRSSKVDEVGQAGGGGVLLSQAGSLTYYGIHTNDVYAEYLTGQKKGAFNGTSIQNAFPTTTTDLNRVEAFAGRPFYAGNALTMELKTSWVDATSIADPSRYITIQATVPTFDRSDSAKWTPKGTATMTLAMVGMHVVGPVNGHPELVWSTFEHVDNAPDAAFYYTNSSGANVLSGYNGAGNWTFLPNGTVNPAPVVETSHFDKNSGNIVARGKAPIAPDNVYRQNPWGNASNETAQAASNTDLISLNVSLLQQLAALNDVRSNYIQVGGIWTSLGQIPPDGNSPNLRGGLQVANSTMETFHQYPDKNNGFVSQNCFTCHGASTSIGVSHIFSSLQPLR